MEHNNENANAQADLGIIDERKNYLYEKLWKLCAGPLCNLPKIGEIVYYFPQGYIELIEASTKEELNPMKPIFDVPSKLLCLVINIQLKVENETDEVYAEISLTPNTEQVINPNPLGDQQRQTLHCFTKVLTTSDTNITGGFTIPIIHATNCLPQLDMSMLVPTQELIAKDLNGKTWSFKHTFRGTPKRHLFTTGWRAFATEKKLVAGDSFVFLKGENGDLRVGIRRAKHQQKNILSSVMSLQCMRNGVIASAMNAFQNQSMFVVVYRPRLSQFVVSYDKFMDAMNNNFNIGSRFKMCFEGEEFSEKIRCSGTVVGVNAFLPYWKNSEWRSLQVQWDESGVSLPKPNNVSPWEIEPLMCSSNVHESAMLTKKRCRQLNIGSTSSNFWTPTSTLEQEIGQSSKTSPRNDLKLGCHDEMKDSKFSSNCIMKNSTQTIHKPSSSSEEMVQPVKEKITTAPTTSFVLFGVDLTRPSETKDTMKSIQSYPKYEISKFSQDKQVNHTQTLTSPKKVQSKHFNSIRSFTKVHKQGVAIGRDVDLTALNGYNQLKQELEKLFDLKDEFQTPNQWEMVFKDNEGDIMLVGDDPWPEFCKMVKKIFICSNEEVEKMKFENKFSQVE